MDRFYVTTPIYYVNDVPHLGTAYTTIVADALARFHRLRGSQVRFLTGTDEHGEKIEQRAKELGVAPRAFVDGASQKFREAWPHLSCTPDDFIRTTEDRHVRVVQDLWRKCRDAGAIYAGTYRGLYCVGCEAYYTEKDLVEHEGAQVCPIHRTKPQVLEEPTYFFKLSAFQDRLLAFYEKYPSFVAPETRRNEVISFVKGGLQDLSVSRTSFSWGIPVPDDDPERRTGLGRSGSDKAEKHVMYVWFDALTNYLSALGEETSVLRTTFWPPDVHLVGKDILRFHTIYWPAFLMAAGFPDEQLPKKVFVHGWLTINGQKMSKSLRNVVEPLALARELGTDVVRFYLLREINFGQDGDFSHAQLIARYNAELADSLGNLLNRNLGLVTKLRADQPTLAATAKGPLEEKLEEAARTALAGAIAGFVEVAPHKAIEAIWGLIRAGNKYVDEAAPWAEAKKGENARVDTILATTLEALRWISVLVWPVMPSVSDRMRAQLGLPALATAQGTDALALTWTPDRPTAGLTVGQPIFPKIDADGQARIFAALGVTTAPEVPAEAPKAADKKPEKKGRAPIEPAKELAYEEFARVDLRIGTVLSCERVPKSDKLLKVQVDLGEEAPRQVVAGIGKTFAPEALVGKQVVVVANLAPAKLMGLESRGMILAVRGESDADLALLSPTVARAAGSRVS